MPMPDLRKMRNGSKLRSSAGSSDHRNFYHFFSRCVQKHFIFYLQIVGLESRSRRREGKSYEFVGHVTRLKHTLAACQEGRAST